jgi:hypothetical protein
MAALDPADYADEDVTITDAVDHHNNHDATTLGEWTAADAAEAHADRLSCLDRIKALKDQIAGHAAELASKDTDIAARDTDITTHLASITGLQADLTAAQAGDLADMTSQRDQLVVDVASANSKNTSRVERIALLEQLLVDNDIPVP